MSPEISPLPIFHLMSTLLLSLIFPQKRYPTLFEVSGQRDRSVFISDILLAPHGTWCMLCVICAILKSLIYTVSRLTKQCQSPGFHWGPRRCPSLTGVLRKSATA